MCVCVCVFVVTAARHFNTEQARACGDELALIGAHKSVCTGMWERV